MYYTVHCNVKYNTIIVLYPSLLAVGGVTHDMCACIVRQLSNSAEIVQSPSFKERQKPEIQSE